MTSCLKLTFLLHSLYFYYFISWCFIIDYALAYVWRWICLFYLLSIWYLTFLLKNANIFFFECWWSILGGCRFFLIRVTYTYFFNVWFFECVILLYFSFCFLSLQYFNLAVNFNSFLFLWFSKYIFINVWLLFIMLY